MIFAIKTKTLYIFQSNILLQEIWTQFLYLNYLINILLCIFYFYNLPYFIEFISVSATKC